MLIEIKIFENEFISELETIEDYFKLVDSSIFSIYKKYNLRLEKKLNSLKEEETQKYYQTHIDEVFKLSEVMPLYHRISIFLLIYNFFEHNLNMLCIIYKNRTKNDLSFKDLSGKGIFRSKLYLTKIMKVTDTFRKNIWNNFIFYSELRNVIVHNGGFVGEENKDLRKKIEKNPGITISSLELSFLSKALLKVSFQI